MHKDNCSRHPDVRDYGGEGFIFNIDHATNMNENFRTAIWTGKHLQLTLMSIPQRSDIGLEVHENVDQFIRIESGHAKVYMGDSACNLCHREIIDSNYAVLIPAGTWHNIVNVGKCPLKLYSVYAPPQHPFGTVHKTAEDASKDEHLD